MSRIRVRDIVRVVALLALMCIPLSGVNAAAPRYVNVQVLALNDFHGNLEASSGLTVTLPDGTRVPAGGVAYLATHLRNLEAANPNTIIVSAGDLIGASPLVSALFHDEPTIEAFNLIGLDLNAVGNHEFDEGAQELLRMQFGGCHPTDGCLDGDPFPGADFRFLAANVVVADRGQPIFTPYVIRSFSGVRVAFIGMTLKGTPTIVTPSGVAGLEFLDEVETVNALVPEIRAKGVQAIVVLMHEGGTQGGGSTINSCVGLSGPVVPIVEGFDDEIDVVVSGHTHQAYNCQIDGKLVTSTNAFGRLVTKIDLTVDRYTGEVTAKTADNRIVTRTVPAAADLAAWVQKYVTLAAPLANRIVGTITGDITRTNNAAGESALGDVIADSQLLATADPGFGEAVVAFMNPGGIRADTRAASAPTWCTPRAAAANCPARSPIMRSSRCSPSATVWSPCR